jgi:hypothetical protein
LPTESKKLCELGKLLYLNLFLSDKSNHTIIFFWTLSIALFLFKTQRYGDWFYLRLQVEPAQLGPNDKTTPYIRIGFS